jgi:anhydro-N-acetylmuramic acid kinase
LSESAKYTVVGLMSGTSQDGLDIALCEFDGSGAGISYKILRSDTIPYSSSQKNKLRSLPYLNVENYFKLHHQFGKFIAKEVLHFIKDLPFKPDAISSHGHTVFHQPKLGFSTQIGCGATIAAQTGITTICDFRSMDVALNGQGAPLVPMGDELLFGNYESCLNIGGIANISFRKNNARVAFDICIANMGLNHFALMTGSDYDKDGNGAKRGSFNEKLFSELNALDFFKQKGARSIGREWFESEFLYCIEKNKLSVNDNLNTLVHHTAFQIAEVLNENKLKNVLVTGGGAHNSFLIEVIKKYYKGEVIIPDPIIVNYKEALIFALLGYLRLNKKINTLSSVTGAKHDSVGGAIYYSK